MCILKVGFAFDHAKPIFPWGQKATLLSQASILSQRVDNGWGEGDGAAITPIAACGTWDSKGHDLANHAALFVGTVFWPAEGPQNTRPSEDS